MLNFVVRYATLTINGNVFCQLADFFSHSSPPKIKNSTIISIENVVTVILLDRSDKFSINGVEGDKLEVTKTQAGGYAARIGNSVASERKCKPTKAARQRNF